MYDFKIKQTNSSRLGGKCAKEKYDSKMEILSAFCTINTRTQSQQQQ